MKVALGIGQLLTGKLLFAGYSEADHCSGFRMANCQWPIAEAAFIE